MSEGEHAAAQAADLAPSGPCDTEADWVERPMPPEERAWLNIASHALYSAQNEAGVQALAADDLALLHRYQATHRALAELTRSLDDLDDGPRWDCGHDNLGHTCGPDCKPEDEVEDDPWSDCAACGSGNACCWKKIQTEGQMCCLRCSHSESGTHRPEVRQ